MKTESNVAGDEEQEGTDKVYQQPHTYIMIKRQHKGQEGLVGSGDAGWPVAKVVSSAEISAERMDLKVNSNNSKAVNISVDQQQCGSGDSLKKTLNMWESGDPHFSM